MRSFLLSGVLALSAGASSAQSLPPGTILPVQLNTALFSGKCTPGQQFTAVLMQHIPLPEGGVIRAGAKLAGHVVRVTRPEGASGAEIALQFDTLKTSRASLALTVSLRALASYMEIDAAQIPAMGADRGTMPAAYTTVQVGGDVVYRGGGPVMHGGEVVGTPVPGGVLVHPRASPEAGCRGAMNGNDRLQAFWVFASDACGAYGLPLLTIKQSGRSSPLGEIVLSAREGELRVPRGTGMLLRVLR